MNMATSAIPFCDRINPHTNTTPKPECVHIFGPSMGVKCETDSFVRKMTRKNTVKIYPTKQFLILDYSYCPRYQQRSLAKPGDNSLGSVHLSLIELVDNNVCLCVCNQWSYTDN